MSAAPITGRLAVRGAELYYEVRGAGPTLVLVGAPMDARGLAPLAERMAADRRVVTTDPRGILRSRVDDPEQERFPELRADDLARLLTHLDAAGAAVFGTCGGAVTALALAQARPALLDALVVHEPPLPELLPDAAERRAAAEETVRFSLERGISSASVAVHFAAGRAGAEPTDQDAVDEQMFLQHEMLASTQWRPDSARLRGLPGPLVVGLGERSEQDACGLAARALAAELGVQPVLFPGGHLGMLEDTEAFAARLRALLPPV